MTPTERRLAKLGSVQITLDLGDGAKPLGHEVFFVERMSGDGPLDPEELASAIDRAWQKAHEQAERTLRLYGFEGIVRAVREDGSTSAS